MSSTVRLKPNRVIIIIMVHHKLAGGIMTVLAISFGVGTLIARLAKHSSPNFIVSASPASAGIAATSGLRRKRRLTIAAVAACLEAGPGVLM